MVLPQTIPHVKSGLTQDVNSPGLFFASLNRPDHELMRQLERKPSSNARRTPGISMLAFGTLAAILLGLAGLSHAGRHSNDREARMQQARVLAAIEHQREATRKDVAGLDAGITAQPSADVSKWIVGNLDQVYVLNGTSPGSIVRVAGLSTDRADLGGRLSVLTQDVAVGTSASAGGMVPAGGDLFDVAALPWPGAGAAGTAAAPRRVIAGARRVDSSYLGEVALSAGARGLKLARMAAGEGLDDGSALPEDWGGVGFTWQPERPGDQLVLRWTIAIVALAALMAVFLILRAKRIAGELYASEARAVEASNCDWLSGLPNRVFFNHVLERELKAIRPGKGRLALFHLDLDRFREINDTFGIEMGDGMIQVVTQRIAEVVRRGDLMARFEGDAFMILQLGVQGPRDCELLAERVRNAMKDPFEIEGAKISASVSIGVALAPVDASERRELARLATLALYRAKREGRDRLAFYKPAMEDEWRRRNSTELQLRQAIDHGGLVLRYQPILNCATGRIGGVEALVRWQHPTEGLIAPDRFIGMAEDRGLILPLGEWVMREACKEARQWPGLRVAVNVSPIQFRHRDFVPTVSRLLAETGLEPSRLELELTEGVIVENEEEAVAAMAQLRHQGVRLALDDFGTGYSSLIYLRRFAFDKIKIDRAFIEALEPTGEDAILVDSVVRLGRALGLTVTAEGVETIQQRDFLKALGCDELQGYLIARPLSASELRGFLELDASARDGTDLDAASRMRAVA